MMTDPDLLDPLVLQRSKTLTPVLVHVHLNEQPEPYGPLISFLLAIASILPYVIAVLLAMMKHG